TTCSFPAISTSWWRTPKRKLSRCSSSTSMAPSPMASATTRSSPFGATLPSAWPTKCSRPSRIRTKRATSTPSTSWRTPARAVRNFVEPIIEAGVEVEPLRDRIVGRVSLDKIKDFEGTVIVDVSQEITEELANQVQGAGIERVRIRSVLTCESRRGVCALCYGRNLATGRMVELGEAVGVIAAQSIGEPGTQLTMRTFHIGGTATRVSERSTLEARNNGVIKFVDLKHVEGRGGTAIAMNRSGLIAIVDEKGREKERYHVVYGARLRVQDGEHVTHGQTLAEWDPFTFSILTETAGDVKFDDLRPGLTIEEQVDEVTGLSQDVVTLPPGDEKHQPAILVRDSSGKVRKKYLMPSRAHLMVKDGDEVQAGDVLAKIPRETTK